MKRQQALDAIKIIDSALTDLKDKNQHPTRLGMGDILNQIKDALAIPPKSKHNGSEFRPSKNK